MYLERKQDLSVYYWLKELFSDTPFVNIVDGFPLENLSIPTISVEIQRINLNPFELGSSDRAYYNLWYIDVFAANKSQRDEFAYKIINALENNILVYDYDVGFPPEHNPPIIGSLIPDRIQMDIVKIMPQLVTKLYYRASIYFTATYTEV